MAAILVWLIIGLVVMTITVIGEKAIEHIDVLTRIYKLIRDELNNDAVIVEHRKRKREREECRQMLEALREKFGE